VYQLSGSRLILMAIMPIVSIEILKEDESIEPVFLKMVSLD